MPLSYRRALHQPFFPVYPSNPPTHSPSPQPTPQIFPKYPSSSSSSSSTAFQNLPFFPLYPSPPPPPSLPSIPTFPANISSLSTPSSHNAPTTTKLIPLIIIPILALVFICLLIAFFFLRGKKRTSDNKTAEADFQRLVPPDNKATNSAATSAHHSSEFLYLGTLVNSHGHVPGEVGPALSSAADSPELRPLPPLSRRNGPPLPPPPPPPPPKDKVRSFAKNAVGKCDQNRNLVSESEEGLKNEEATGSTAEICGEMIDGSDEASRFRKPKLKPLHWDKVKASSERSMVWDQLKSCSFQLNEEMIETLFGCDSGVNGKGNARKMSASLLHDNAVLDPKRSQNIAILLRALNVTKEEVCDALMEGNTDSLGSELLETLLRMAPTKEEEIKLREYNDESSYKLGPAERFLKAMLDVPFAFKRVDAMLNISNFESEVQYLRKSFETLELACEELRSSKIFRKLLDAVLKTGNRMNVGTNRGDAQAFKLDTLLKLIDVKGADRKTTLLHFVVQEISRAEGFRANQSNSLINELESRRLGLNIVSGIGTELSNVKKAATMDSEILSGYVSKLAIGIETIRDVVRLNDTEQFNENMIRFLKMAEVEITKLQNQEGFALSLVKEITEYFHGDSAKEEAHPFRIFMVVRDFLAILDQVCKDVGRDNERNMVSSIRQFPKIHSMQIGSSDDESSSLSSMSS